MKVGYIGNFQVPFTTENDLKWSLEQLGHTVLPYQENEYCLDDIAKDIQERNIDLLLYTHTHGWESPTLSSYTIDDILELAKKCNIPTASVHLDFWRYLQRAVDVGTHPFWRSKYVFTADGGSNDWYRSKGINHFWLKPGVVKRDCHLGTYDPKYDYDVAFVGSYKYHAEWPYRKKLIDWLTSTYGNRFHRFGQPNETVRGEELNNLYASVKVVVGDTLCPFFKHPNYWSDRVYETLGRGGFLIHPYVKGMEEEFTPGVDIEFYNYDDFDRLKYLIDYYLVHYVQRKRIQLSGHEMVRDNCTYTERMKQMLHIIGEYETELLEKLHAKD